MPQIQVYFTGGLRYLWITGDAAGQTGTGYSMSAGCFPESGKYPC